MADVNVGTGAIATVGALTGSEILVCLQSGVAKEVPLSRLVYKDTSGYLATGLAFSGSYSAIYHFDTTPGAQSLANGGTIDLVNFSGMVLITNHSNGGTALFICGGGSVQTLGTNAAGMTLTFVATPTNRYRLTNVFGSTATFGVMTFRTRTSA